MALSLRHGSQGGGRAYAMTTMDARGVVTIQHNAPEIGQGTHNLFSVIAARTLGLPQSQVRVRAPDTAVNLPFAGVSALEEAHLSIEAGEAHALLRNQANQAPSSARERGGRHLPVFAR